MSNLAVIDFFPKNYINLIHITISSFQNIYDEKVYCFLWYWMVFVAIASFISFFVWFIHPLIPQDIICFVTNHLELGHMDVIDTSNTFSKQDRNRDFRKFTTDYLKQDGAFLLRLIAHNTDNITTTEVTRALCEVWKDRHDGQPDDWRDVGSTTMMSTSREGGKVEGTETRRS